MNGIYAYYGIYVYYPQSLVFFFPTKILTWLNPIVTVPAFPDGRYVNAIDIKARMLDISHYFSHQVSGTLTYSTREKSEIIIPGNLSVPLPSSFFKNCGLLEFSLDRAVSGCQASIYYLICRLLSEKSYVQQEMRHYFLIIYKEFCPRQSIQALPVE